MTTINKGLVLATRTDCHVDQLRAFLLHHLQVCDVAVVLVDRRPYETPDAVIDACREFGERVVVRDHESSAFNNAVNTDALSKAVSALASNCDIVLHIDKDEFINPRDLWKVGKVVEGIRAGECDYAKGTMICRFSVGGYPSYCDELPSYEEFAKAAPVRSRLINKYGFPDCKCAINRAPGIHIHHPPSGSSWRKSQHELDLEHFRWTLNKDAKTQVKGHQHPQHIAGPICYRERMVREHSADFVGKLDEGFHPYAWSIEGFMDYCDLYREIAKALPDGGVFCEVGVFKGRSLCYMGEYLNLLGKSVDVIGHDAFDPLWMPWGTARPMRSYTSEVWMQEVRDKLIAGCPVNTPRIIKSLSVDASHHADNTVDGVWLDADHSADGLCAEVLAWLPKLKKGAILAGHDFNRASVIEGLRMAGIKPLSKSKSSWVAVGDNFNTL